MEHSVFTITTTTILWPFVWDYPYEPVPEETFSHLPILTINHPLEASSIYYDPNIYKTRMWADAQRDGRPAKYRWRFLFNTEKYG